MTRGLSRKYEGVDMMSRYPSALLLLAKYPEPGSVKTRLVNGTEDNGFNGLKHICNRAGTPIGEEKAGHLAANLYRAFLTDRFRAHQGDSYHLYLGTSQPEHTTLFRAITGDKVLYQTVQGANLGEMMFRIFEALLERYQRVIISGTDFPYVSESIVERVLHLMGQSAVEVVRVARLKDPLLIVHRHEQPPLDYDAAFLGIVAVRPAPGAGLRSIPLVQDHHGYPF